MNMAGLQNNNVLKQANDLDLDLTRTYIGIRLKMLCGKEIIKRNLWVL